MSEKHPKLEHYALAKVPEIVVFFWVVKILTTAMGETGSDWANATIGPAIAVPLMLLFLWFALRRQLDHDRYEAPRYWLVVTAVATFGTSAADALHEVGAPFVATTILWAGATAYLFRRWHKTEGTLSIHSVFTRRREKFYWATVLATFALGTAGGDLTAVSLNLGYFVSILLFGAMMLVPLIGWWKFNFNSIAAFWGAYVLTRPFGASISDWMAVPKSAGGLGFGPGPVTIVLAALIVAAVYWLAKKQPDLDLASEEEDERMDHLPHAHHHDVPRRPGKLKTEFEGAAE